MLPSWMPFIQFWAPYFSAGGAAMFTLLVSKEPYTLRFAVGQAGLAFILGGTLAPLVPLVTFVPGLTKPAQNLGIASAIGAGWISRDTIKGVLQRLIGGKSDDQ